MALLLVLLPFKQSAQAQFPLLPNFSGNSSIFMSPATEKVISGCIHLDGRCVLEVGANESDLSARITEIEQRLENITGYYLQNPSADVDVRQEAVGQLVDIYVAVDQREIRLLSVTSQDANLKGMTIQRRAEQVILEIKNALQQAKREREQEYLIAQAKKGAIALLFLVALTIALYALERRFHQEKKSLQTTLDSSSEQAISTQLTQNQRQQLAEIKYRLIQIFRFAVWLGGSLYLVGLFPYTRFLQGLIINIFRVPFRLFIVGLGTYFLTRFSFILIDKFNGALANNYLLTPEANLRLQLRISTISSVAKSIIAVSWTVVGVLVGLSVIGINIGPLLAGAGLIGVAISLASQNLIRDAINGFFIILEDQYAVGDVVGIADATGFVEAINLRITQLRDTEGRLITIPNSEIRTVTNYTSNWSQVDLKIPIAYHADVEKAMRIIEEISDSMMRDRAWKKEILEAPVLLGVDEFSHQGIMIRVWIKTKPLQQWPIGREYRRRLKIALDQAGIDLALPHQKIWLSQESSPSDDQ
ncbi:mechanosensitive ion channel family protein [Halothece sp. PCC 7418]|uniref:mechanosensitive ion channel family protein n=1 Tax=Halothece sp. (strain PCC 7418) TaxID=65093 RepID=UPI0003021D30|nr:mechanosensitive ion channel family protein [Halothece sp. PCC 7418]